MSGAPLRRLDESTIAHIAAGEVIDRPARVVSELVDNALDAGAGRIDVAVDGDGTDRIRVADDGHGLDREAARLAVERHTTSKLPAGDVDSAAHGAADVLPTVSTLGFRGEALSAIADCATLELVTNAGGAVGTRLRVVDGEVTVSDAGRAQGTTVTVTDLFADRPVRRESLAGPATEFGHISDLLSRYVLARSDVRFSLTHDGRKTLSATGGGARDALRGVYDADTARQATVVEHREALDADALGGRTAAATDRPVAKPAAGPPDDGAELELAGVLAYPSVTRATREHVRVAVDGRPVVDSGLRRAVIAGYGSLLPGDRYPIAAVDLSVPTGWVDPNVHPAKKRVGLRGREAIESRVEAAVREALSTADARRAAAAATDLKAPLESADRSDPFADLRVIGSFRALYLLCADDDALLVIDQHAAHERVNFERLRAAVAGAGVPTAPLEPPETVSVSPAAAAAAEAHRGTLATLGFDVEPFGGGTLRVSGVPAPLGRVADADLLCDTLDELAAGVDPEAEREALLAELACHPSLKAGDDLAREAARALLDRLGECEQPFACPHGRPTVCTIDEATLAAGFDRDSTRFR